MVCCQWFNSRLLQTTIVWVGDTPVLMGLLAPLSGNFPLYIHQQWKCVNVTCGVKHSDWSEVSKNTIEVFLLWKKEIRSLLNLWHCMVTSICTLLLPPNDGTEHAEFQRKNTCMVSLQFPKNILKVHCGHIYIIKSLGYSGIHTVLSQTIITKPTQTEKLKIGKWVMWSFFLYRFSLLYEICCVHKPAHSNSGSEHEHRLKKR